MALYLISYDIAAKNSGEYDELWATLKSMNATRILLSEWLVVKPTGAAGAIYNEIVVDLLTDDRLLVVEVLRGAYWDKLKISDESMDELLKHARG